jgi:hypothetical protein
MKTYCVITQILKKVIESDFENALAIWGNIFEIQKATFEIRNL